MRRAATSLRHLIRTMAPPSVPQRRLASLATTLEQRPPRELLGTLKLGDLALPIYETEDPARLPLSDRLLDTSDPYNAENMHWILQKFTLGQDIFLFGPPGLYSRRLILSYCRLVNRPFEFVSLHRDIGEGELKQGREIREGGVLEYVDSSAVRAAKLGHILILEGIERAERGVLPILNNLLENREMNLEDGTLIVSQERYQLMQQNGEDVTNFVAAHPDFRVCAIGAPVPPYPGFPLDPPFRSRFQCRYLDPLSTSQALARQVASKDELVEKMGNVIASLQISKEMQKKMASGLSDEELPLFPQTALLKLAQLIAVFPPPHASISTPAEIINVLLTIHPALAYNVKPASWRALEAAFEKAGMTQFLGISECDPADVGVEGEGIWGWKLAGIERSGEATAKVTFVRAGVETIHVEVAAGPKPFAPWPLVSTPDFQQTPRFLHLLGSIFQLHALGSWDISILPPSSSLQSSSSSTTILISTFASLLGYELTTVHLYKELGGREVVMRRVVENGQGGKSAGTTGWEVSPLVNGSLKGHLVHLEGIDTLGSTAGSLARLISERESELWEGQRIVGGPALSQTELEESRILRQAHPSFRIIATSSKSSPPREWLTEELSSMFVALPTLAMSLEEESSILYATGCAPALIETLVGFARNYRRVNSTPGSKNRRLGTASLKRIATKLAAFPSESLFELLSNTLLAEFLPTTTKAELLSLLADAGIVEPPLFWNPPAQVTDTHLVFPAASDPAGRTSEFRIPLFDAATADPEGASHVPYMNNYLDNSNQTGLMRSLAMDLVALNEHVLFLGNQGAGKNKVVDRLLQLLNRPREYIQLHRDSTTQGLMYQTSLDGGVIRYIDSPLLRAVKYGRVIMIDEVDKAGPPVVASLASLASRGEMTLADGRKIVPTLAAAEENDIVVHPNFRIILLGNRPGAGFLGNNFLRVLGDAFSVFAVSNPDPESEYRVLSLLAPDLDVTLLHSLVGVFGDLRKAFDAGTIVYPYSLRELLALVRHLKRFPDEPLEQVLRSVFDYDVHRDETMDLLYDILRKNKLVVDRIGIDAVRGAGKTEGKRPVVIEFTPTGSTELGGPKEGKATDKAHVGGNTWQGGTGGRDTAGLGGRGGYKRLYKGHDINQVSQELKDAVPEEVKTQAREMARAELAEKLKQIDLTNGQASIYSQYYASVQSHVSQLVTFLDNLEANEEERVWLKRQSDGELDEGRLTEGLTGEAAIYKRRGMEKPELGRPQLKPKRIRFIFDLSASMYRNQYDGRLTRSLEAAVMVLEAFSRLSKKEKYRIDLVGQSGEEAVIPLVAVEALPKHAGERWRVIEKMAIIPQYCWSGDHTVEAISAGVATVAESDSDDFFVIIVSDANFERYGITPEDLKRSMNSNPKVKVNLIAIGEGAEAEWLPKALPGRAFRVKETGDIARTLTAILGNMLDR